MNAPISFPNIATPFPHFASAKRVGKAGGSFGEMRQALAAGFTNCSPSITQTGSFPPESWFGTALE
jgi:hypothetical protein